MTPLFRPLFCPICGAKLLVEVADTTLPEIHRLPEHAPASDVNLCSGLVVTVTLDYDRCAKCGGNMVKNSAGVCRHCFTA